MTPRAIKATYADWRPVKSRKVLQLVFEIPLEQQTEALQLLGAPLPDREVWCGIALLREDPPMMPKKEKRRMQDLPLSQQAALLCEKESFWLFMGQTHSYDLHTTEQAAVALRHYCGIASRSEILPGSPAGERFMQLQAAFDLWKIDV